MDGDGGGGWGYKSLELLISNFQHWDCEGEAKSKITEWLFRKSELPQGCEKSLETETIVSLE